MAIRIEWDEFEIALLIEACEEFLRKGKPKSEVVKTVSSNLRKRAISKNIAIDDVFRNENGIALQMQKMQVLDGVHAFLWHIMVKKACLAQVNCMLRLLNFERKTLKSLRRYSREQKRRLK